MVKINKIVRAFTHAGARAKHFTPEMELKRALMNCLLWEDQFYENGVSIADRMKAIVPLVAPEKVAQLAIEAREQMKLRHAPLLIVREMARHEKHRVLVAVRDHSFSRDLSAIIDGCCNCQRQVRANRNKRVQVGHVAVLPEKRVSEVS